MNSREIKALRKKFIVIAMVSIFLAMLFIGATVNTVSLIVTRTSINRTLDLLIADAAGESISQPERSSPFWEVFSTDYRRSRYYVVTFDQSGEIVSVESNMQDSSDESQIEQYGMEIVQSNTTRGHKGDYYYKLQKTDELAVLALLDTSLMTFSELRFMYITFALGTLGMIITFFLVRHFSERAIKPEIENSMRQKQFITNASHELKTPLAVIRANTEMTEMTQGESEWTQSTLRQVDHLNGMIQNLVMITRSEEKEDRSELSKIDASKAVGETIDTYEPLAAQSGLRVERHIEPSVEVVADESKIRQLSTILMDNAIKYCDEGGMIQVSLTKGKNGTGLALTVSNSYKEGENADIKHFFDRFYREDASHNIDKGGYGIGLSIAQSICSSYSGDIRAEWKDGVIYFICTIK